MSAMLGEMLLKVGALKPEQLDQALQAQAIYGGRLGTNLVEMGFLSEEELARALYEKLGVPCVEPAQLNGLPPEMLALIPAELVARYRALPVAASGRRLTVAMADPSDFRAIEEIGFVTGMVVQPRVCSDLRLSLALERYYGIKRAVRYIPVEGGARSRYANPSSPEGVASDRGGDPMAGAHWEEEEEPLDARLLAERFSSATTAAEVLSILMRYLASEFDVGAFLKLKGGAVSGVRALGAGVDPERAAAFASPVGEIPLLKSVAEERSFVVGEVVTGDGNDKLFSALGVAAPAVAALLPVSLDGRVAAVVCVCDRQGRLSGGAFDLQRVTSMAELAFAMTCLRKQIHSC
ncbi:general secretion pathway protein GspE [Geomonas sp. Red32]|uniref:GspE/PulE/PilB domain-containing protein n=1 Tax=Geomonas sp. Red32 TaxID=2912856 RepID=UPI00202D00C6|nr:general secretion pathway protein GspE [Geomonas sp. Red32]MCM0080615.1 general secretion pathway protein GspE [Geomonas sp. Red32]